MPTLCNLPWHSYILCERPASTETCAQYAGVTASPAVGDTALKAQQGLPGELSRMPHPVPH